MKLFELLQSQITELTDIEPGGITLDTLLDDIHLVSLDSVAQTVHLFSGKPTDERSIQ
ncbi:hypothetical protein [Photorhabdus stackebrandtii]|uniref:hypothetical protein n=1 Tax=Photorhabdus stackebrandtii TaxID=1123042 RepID=UPI00140A6890|nr:hypothetical protein [Photorhabdus stackebrandtii]